MKRKILYVSPNSLMGGGEINQMLLIANLDPATYDVEVVVGGQGPYADELRKKGVRVSVLPMPCLRLRSRRLPSPVSLILLYRHLLDVKPHLVHSSSLPEDHHSALAARLARVPVVHDVQTIVHRAHGLDRWRAAHSAAVICISRAIRQSVARARLAAPMTEVIYSGVDVEAAHNADGLKVRRELNLSACDVIGIASRLSPEKGQEYFLQAAASLKDRFPNARFLVAGGPLYAPAHYDDHLKHLACKLGLGSQAIFTGFRGDILNVMAAMDVLVCAADQEALGRVVLEAMALGKPVIATRAGGPMEIVEHGVTGFLVPPRDAAALAGAISTCLSDLDAARRMGHTGRERAQTLYTIRNNVRQVHRLYDEILTPAARRRPDEHPHGS